MKTRYFLYEDALQKFLECQEPVHVTKQYAMPGYDTWDSPTELFEAEDGDEEAEPEQEADPEQEVEPEMEDPDGDVAAEETSEGDGGDETDSGDDDVAMDDGTESADEVNAEQEPTSVSAKQLLQELVDNGIYGRVAKAAMDTLGSKEVSVGKLLPIIALAVKKFMQNKNYASLSKNAMKAIVMNVANTMAHPPKQDDQAGQE